MYLLLLAMMGVCWSPARAAGDDPSDVVDGTQGDEAVAFRETVDRFSSRMNEFDNEARQIIQAAKAREYDNINRGYAASLDGADGEETRLRAEAVERLQDFLRRYPNSSHTPHAMFLLGDLYYEESELQYTADMKAADESSGEDIDFANAAEDPVCDYSASERLFRGIVDNFPDYSNADGSLYMLGWLYNRPDGNLHDPTRGSEAYLRLLERYPESDFSAAAHAALGDHYFENYQIKEAIVHYQRVVELHEPDGRHYERGLFGLAWAYYKHNRFSESQQLLVKLLDWSEESKLRSGRRSGVHEEAEEYLAISFNAQADAGPDGDGAVTAGPSASASANRFFRSIGGREYEANVYLRLALSLEQTGPMSDAIAVYNTLVEKWPNAADNPKYLFQTARLYMTMEPEQLEQANAVMTRLNELFNRDGAWAHANRNDPDALAVADSFIEQSLASVAGDIHKKANKTSDRALWAEAARLYGQYLNRFQFAKDYYDIQWNLAETLRLSGQLAAADREYGRLLKSTGHPHSELSSWRRMTVRRHPLLTLAGPDGLELNPKPPPGAVLEARVTSEQGKHRAVYTVGEAHARYIEVADALADANFKDEKVQGYLDRSRATLVYEPGKILFEHGHVEEARARLLKVIERWPRKNVGAFAAEMIVTSYQDAGDLKNMRVWGGKFARMQLGEDSELKQLEFAGKAEWAAFNMAQQLRDSGENEEAAQAYVDFMTEFPKSEYLKQAHKNAAYTHKDLGRLERANELFLDFVTRIENGQYKNSGKDWAIYDMIASNYALTLELEEAVRFYELLYQRSAASDEPYELAYAALFNAGSLKIGLGDHAGAAATLERYATENREQGDAEAVMFKAGAQWEKVSPEKGAEFYVRYLQTFGDENPNNVMKAHYRMAKLNEAMGRDDAGQAWDRLLAAYHRLLPGGKLGEVGRKYAAMAALRPVKASYEAFGRYAYGNDQAAITLLLTEKKAELGALGNQCGALIKNYKEFESTSAGLYMIGSALLQYSDMVYNVPQTPDLDDDNYETLLENLDDLRIEFEDGGRARLTKALSKAREQGLWSDWTSLTLETLATRFPEDFSPERAEVRGQGASVVLPMARPMSAAGEPVVDVNGSPTEPSPVVLPKPQQTPAKGEGVWQ